jgi:hypothetical protein
MYLHLRIYDYDSYDISDIIQMSFIIKNTTGMTNMPPKSTLRAQAPEGDLRRKYSEFNTYTITNNPM